MFPFVKRKTQKSSEKPTGNLSKAEKKRAQRLNEELQATTSNTITYQALYENGLMQVGDNYYSQTFSLGDVNYQTVGMESKGIIMEKHSDLINSLDEHTSFQLTLFNQRVNLEKFQESILYQENNDSYNHYRQELNDVLKKTLVSGENNFKTSKFITFGRTATNPKQGYRFLSDSGEYFRGGYTEIEVDFLPMDGENRVNLLADMLRGEKHLPFSYRDLDLANKTTKDFIAPMSLNFKNKEYIAIDDKFLQILYVRDYGSELGDRFLRDLIRLDKEMIISLHAKSYEKSESMSKVKTKKFLMETQKTQEQQKNVKAGVFMDKASQGLETNLTEAEELIETMTRTGDKLFDTLYLIGIFAETTDELTEVFHDLKRVAGSNDLIIEKMPFMQEPALNSLLPLGKNFLPELSRSLLTSNIAVNSPWTSVDLQDRGGKYYGINQISKNVITLDRTKLNTPSGLILGTSGSGKGMATKHEIITTKLKEATENTEIIIIDPENEYSIIGEAFGGEVINISPDSSTYLNVLDLSDSNIDEDPIKVKSDFMISWIGKLLNRKLEGREESIIDRVTRLTYEHFEQPTLEEWVFVLSKQPEESAQSLALDMELYVKGSLNIFSKATNIDTNSRFLIYNVKKLGKKLKQVGLMVVFEQIWNRVVLNQRLGKRTWIYFDEMQLLLSDDLASDFFFELWSRVRKYGAIPTGITQNVETLLLDPNGRRIIANSEFMILLKQAQGDRDDLVELLGLSNELEKYLRNPEKGSGLLKAGGVIIPFKNKIPDYLDLYRIMSTEPNNMSV